MWYSKMTPTADGKGLLLSQDNSIFSFNCVSETNCAWKKTDIELKIKRQFHVMLTVPAALVDQCEGMLLQLGVLDAYLISSCIRFS